MARTYDDLFLEGEKATEKLIAVGEKELVAEYKRALDSIRSTLADFYAKYAQGDVLTYAEMSKYNRLSTLFDQINAEYKSLGKRGVNHLIKLNGEVYQESFYRTAYAIEAGGGPGAMVSISWGQLAPSVIEASVMNPLSGLSIKNRYAARTAEQLVRIKSEITQSLIQGESYPKMAKRIKKELDGDATRAMRVARTEGHRNTQAGRLESLDRAEGKGVDLVRVWSAALDARTRDDHAAMDGQEADKDGLFHFPSGGTTTGPGLSGIAEQDINCRCVVRGQVAGFAPKVRRIRGEGEQAYKDYNTWKTTKKT
jgi:SPP1 gp7 family putative phage head morphogenesis protein